MVEGDDRPSSARRKQLREADANSGTVPTVSNFFPLERYYEASDKVLQSFEVAFEKRRLDEAFVYGMRYCTFCVEGIVKHDYYRQSKFQKRRAQTNQNVKDVLTKLELVAELMDVEEVEKERQRKILLERQRQERLRRQREKEQRQIEELKKRVAAQKMAAPAAPSTGNVEESALAKLQRLSQPSAPVAPSPPAHSAVTSPSQPPSKRASFQADERPEPDGHCFPNPDQIDTGSTSSLSIGQPIEPLPPPLLPPGEDDDSSPDPVQDPAQDENAPPSYNQILAQTNTSSYFGPGAVSEKPESFCPPYEAVVKPKPKPKAPKKVNIRQYIARAQKTHREYQQQRKIIVSAQRTFQGRLGGSTNGCTVISACIVSRHMETHGGVKDHQIVDVIDKECIPLLRTIRSKLDLNGSSLIIPSDVHDHLVDHKWLFQHKFSGATGGNIVDPDHLGELLKLLDGEPGKTQHLKAGATLFFREHVVSIVKFPTSRTEAIYDMIDSLPVCNGRASRTRCDSLDALRVHLEWYSSHKFSDSNCAYIERNRWDDMMADFDPRVFQAFVWTDLPKPS